jgi:hypothetical protein
MIATSYPYPALDKGGIDKEREYLVSARGDAIALIETKGSKKPEVVKGLRMCKDMLDVPG